MLAIVRPGRSTLSVEVGGMVEPAGKTVAKPLVPAPSLTMFSTAAVALMGMPARPATLTRMVSGVMRVNPNAP
jgi:hypothetical protein